MSHTHTCTSSPCDFSPQPFDDNKDECKEHQFPLSCQGTCLTLSLSLSLTHTHTHTHTKLTSTSFNYKHSLFDIETQHDEADYKTELMKILKIKPHKEKQNCQENKLSGSNLGQLTTHEAERALSPSESPSPSIWCMDSRQNTKLDSIFDQYGDIVKVYVFIVR